MKFKPTEEDFRDIGPYEGAEVRAALKRVFNHPDMAVLASFLFPTWSESRVKEQYNAVHSIDDFQDQLIAAAIKSLLSQSSAGLTFEGAEKLDKESSYLFVSNHRDIALDPALFAYGLHGLGYRTPKVALGDNLLFSEWITDLVRLNKSLIVKRNIGGRELLKASITLSSFIRRDVTENRDSVWIAQREGRAKDGKDVTQPALLKMLAMSGEKADPAGALASLRIIPVSISYEYDPCALLKARELLITRREGGYEKKPGEDLQAILKGVTGFKGGICITLGRELSADFGKIPAGLKRDEFWKMAASLIDREVISGYKLWPSNCIAEDLLTGGARQSVQYSESQKRDFETRMEKQLENAGAEKEALRELMLSAYAQAVRSKDGLTA